jgi:hypothetical protein
VQAERAPAWLRRGAIGSAILHDGARLASGGARQPLPALGLHRRRKGDVARLEHRIVEANATGFG